MNILRRVLSSTLMLALLISVFPTGNAMAASNRTLPGTNAAPDHVIVDTEGNEDEDDMIDFTDDAERSDKDDFDLWEENQDDRQALYIGMEAEFDRIVFEATDEDDFEKELKLEFYRDGFWNNLHTFHDVEIDQDDELIYIDFERPTDWDKTSVDGEYAFWIRITPDVDEPEQSEVEQIGTRTYNLRLEIEDEDGDEVENLNEDEFEVRSGSDNKIYGFEEIDNEDGVYELALQAEESDTRYTIEIDNRDFEMESFGTASLNSARITYLIELEEDDRDGRDRDRDDDDRDRDRNGRGRNCDMPFRDLFDHWSYNSVSDLYCAGILSRNTYFYPNDYITRAEFLKIVMEVEDIDLDDYNDENEPFRDVNRNDWYYDYVVAAYELDFVDYDLYFNPNQFINRAEALALMIRVADVRTTGIYTSFPDVNSYDWFAKYVATAVDFDVVNGYSDGTFRPANFLTRAEAAEMMHNAYDPWY